MSEIRADIIKKALSDRATSRHNVFFTEVYTNDGLYAMQRFDGLELHGVHETSIFGYEIKVSRSDFLQDSKWTGYLNFCNEFSFVCPEGLIKEDELPLEIGLTYYKPKAGKLRVKRKALTRKIDLPAKLLIGLIFNRIDQERHPFFTDKRERIAAYLEEKENQQVLAVNFKNKLIEERNKAIAKIKKLEKDFEYYKEQAEVWEKVNSFLYKSGISCYSAERTIAELGKIISNGSNPKVFQEITQATGILNRALERMKGA
jgi:hypothetical protein